MNQREFRFLNDSNTAAFYYDSVLIGRSDCLSRLNGWSK